MTTSHWKWYSKSSPWLQRMFLHIQKYDYNIRYKPGKDMVLANHLNHFPSHSNLLPIPIAHNVHHVQLSNAELDNIWGAIECDPVFSTISHLTLRGWPDCRQEVPPLPDISGVPGMNCPLNQVYSSRGQESVFPQSCSTAPLLICMVHIGINRMEAQVREALHWPSIDADIASYVCQCTICTKPLPLHNLCYLEMFPMAPDRILQPITSPTRVESTSWSAIYSASTPSFIKYP